MKSFKLFKRLGALITAVAVLASMGTVAFADGTETAPTITITSAEINPTEVNPSNDEGLYTVTVEYAVTGTIGDMGVTMLAYTAGSSNEELKEDDPETSATNELTTYKDTYAIAYVTQEDPVLTEGAGSISFNVDTTDGDNAIEVGEGEKILILLGGDDVVAPASALVTTYWGANAIAIKSGDDAFDGFGSALEVNLDDEETVEDVLAEALAAYDIFVTDGENEAEITWADAEIVVAETTEADTEADGATHKATITVGTDVELDGAYISEALTTTIFFSASETWTADTLTISETEYVVYGSDLVDAGKEVNEATITAALKEAVLAETITAGKAETELEVEVDAAENAEAITVAIKEGTLVGDVDATDVAFVVTLAANTVLDAGVTVGEEAITTEITLDYIVTKPTSWDVTGAEFKYTEGTALAVTYDYPDGSDKVAKAKAALIGEKVELTGANPGETYDYEITEEVANAAVFTEENTVATITIPAATYDEMAIVGEATPVAINIAYTENAAGFTASDAVLVKGTDEVTTLNVTVTENTAEKIKAAIVAEGLSVKATLTRGDYEVADVLIPVTADMVTAAAADITEPATTGSYTADITVATTVDITVDEGVVGKLAVAIDLDLTGTATVQSWDYGDVNHDGNVTFTDAQLTAKYAVAGSVAGTFDAALANVDGSATAVREGITFTDAQLIAKKAVNSSYQFPVEQ